MKRVTLRTMGNGPTARELFTIVLNAPGADGKGINIQDMRKRMMIIGKLEDAPDPEYLILEDAEYETLKRLFEGFPWGMTSKDILQVAEDLEKAEKWSPPKAETPRG